MTATAATIADEQGVNAVTLSAVATRLGVTQPAMYRHVSDFRDLQRQVALLARAELRAALLESAAGRSGENALLAAAEAWRSYVQQHPGRYEMTDRVPLTGDAATEESVGSVVAVLARVLEGFGLDTKSAVDTAWVIRSALHGFANLEVGRGNPESFQADAAFHRMTQLLIAGLRNVEPSARAP